MRPFHLLLLALPLVLVLGLAGCRSKPAAPAPDLPPLDTAALADASPRGARAALDQYLAARRALNYDRVYQVLSARTQAVYSLDDLKAFFKSYRGYTFKSIGDVEELQDEWVRFPVRGVRWDIKGRPVTEGDLWYVTAHYDGGRWGVALADPLIERAFAASVSGSAENLHRVANTMLHIDPFSFRAHVQKGYAYLYNRDGNNALTELRWAALVAPPPAVPEVAMALGDLYRVVNRPQEAAAYYEQAAQGMTQYEGLYDNGQMADLNRALAQMRLQAGDQSGAAAAAVAAQVQNPFSLRSHFLAATLVTRP